MHVLGSCEASAQYSPINFFVNLFHSKNSNLLHCFSDLIHIEYRKLHKNNGHSPFVSPSIMRSSVGQCRNIRFRQLSASHVIITSDVPPSKTKNNRIPCPTLKTKEQSNPMSLPQNQRTIESHVPPSKPKNNRIPCPSLKTKEQSNPMSLPQKQRTIESHVPPSKPKNNRIQCPTLKTKEQSNPMSLPQNQRTIESHVPPSKPKGMKYTHKCI